MILAVWKIFKKLLCFHLGNLNLWIIYSHLETKWYASKTLYHTMFCVSFVSKFVKMSTVVHMDYYFSTMIKIKGFKELSL